MTVGRNLCLISGILGIVIFGVLAIPSLWFSLAPNDPWTGAEIVWWVRLLIFSIVWVPLSIHLLVLYFAAHMQRRYSPILLLILSLVSIMMFLNVLMFPCLIGSIMAITATKKEA